MITKTALAKQIQQFPESFSLESLIERLIFIDKVDKGLQESNDGNVISEKELEKEIEKWFE